MSMPAIELHMYEALTEAGVKPDAARRVERQIETAIQAGQDVVRSESRELLASKQDLQAVESRLSGEISTLRADFHKALNEQTWKLVSFVVVANGIMLALLRYLG